MNIDYSYPHVESYFDGLLATYCELIAKRLVNGAKVADIAEELDQFASDLEAAKLATAKATRIVREERDRQWV